MAVVNFVDAWCLLVHAFAWLCACSSNLRRNIENLEKNSVTSLQTMVNLGSEVYMQAEVYAFDIFIFPGAAAVELIATIMI